MSALGDRLQELRERAGIRSQQALAERLGVAKNRVWSYEKGNKLPEIDYLAEFCTLTGADFFEVLTLRLQAAGHESVVESAEVRESFAHYGIDQGPAEIERTEQARQLILNEKDLDSSLSLALMEIVTRGDISERGLERLISILKRWSLDDERAWEWIEEHSEEVDNWAREPD